MTVCANRTDSPGFFTPCKSCPCGKEVEAELAAELINNSTEPDTTES